MDVEYETCLLLSLPWSNQGGGEGSERTSRLRLSLCCCRVHATGMWLRSLQVPLSVSSAPTYPDSLWSVASSRGSRRAWHHHTWDPSCSAAGSAPSPPHCILSSALRLCHREPALSWAPHPSRRAGSPLAGSSLQWESFLWHLESYGPNLQILSW